MSGFTFTVFGKPEHLARYDYIMQTLPPALLKAMDGQMLGIADYIRVSKLSGQVLNRRSGDLSRSITGQATLNGMKVTGIVGTKGVPYAGVHEFGGTYEIPATSRMITQVFGRPVFPHPVLVRPHSATYPERSYIRSAATEKAPKVAETLESVTSAVIHAA